MNRTIVLMALALVGCSAGQPTRVGGIVSTNPCADQLLISLVPPGRIAAISHYSQQAGASSISLALARRFRTTAGTAEEVIALKPRLVLASSFTPASTLAAYRTAGLTVLTLDSPTSIAASRSQIISVANALDEPAAGARLVAKIDRAISEAAPHTSAHPTALMFLSDNFANGGPSLLTEMMARAGFSDMSGAFGLFYSGNVPIESVIAHPPRLILDPDPSARTAVLRRQVVAHAGFHVVEALFPRQLINCGGPTIIAAMKRLAVIRSSVLP